MKHLRKVGLTVVASLLSVGVLGMTAPAAHADWAWPCKGCAVANR